MSEELEQVNKETELFENDPLPDEVISPANEIAVDGSVAAAPLIDSAELGKEKAEETLADKVRIISPFKLVIKRFFRSRLSVVGLSVFLAVLLFSFLGPLFVGWEEEEIDYCPAQREV